MANNWIKYISRSYQQIKDDVLSRIVADVPEMTDHTESNLFVKMISIWGGIAEMLGYYIDNAAREALLISARIYSNMIKHAFANDYRVRCKQASSTSVTFTLSGAATQTVVIPSGTRLRNAEGVQFVTLQSAQIAIGETSINVEVSQRINFTGIALGTSDGTAYQEFELPSNDTADLSVAVRVASTAWSFKETLAYSAAADTHFVQTVNEDKVPIIRFGDDFNGAIPANGAAIEIDYATTQGHLGNVGANNITTIVDTISVAGGLTLSVTNVNRSSGGSDFESIDQIRNRIPKARRTLQRAVTEQDFVDVASLVSGVASGGVDFNCGKVVDVYVVPEGGGIASDTLLAAVQTDLTNKKIVGLQVSAKSAGEVRLIFEIDVTIEPQFQTQAVSDAIKLALTNFLSYQQQEISGTVHLSDIYQIVENVGGVRFSDIKKMYTRPYARRSGSTTIDLDWSREITANSSVNSEWRIQMISATQYQLFQDNNFLGLFDVGNAVSRSEIVFTANTAAYSIGDEWRFVTYPYYGTVNLDEPSIPVSLNADITLNISGGL